MVRLITDRMDVDASVVVADSNGDDVSSSFTDADYRVLDEVGAEVIGWTSSGAVVNATNITVTVPAASNTLGADVRRAYRKVEFRLNHGAGVAFQIFEYIIEAGTGQALVIGDNSFQTFGSALLRSLDTAEIDFFKAGTREEQILGLTGAYKAIGTIAFEVSGVSMPAVTSLNEVQLGTLDPRFVDALKDVQIIEANESLNPDSIHRKRTEGLLAESIGESSVMFRPEKVLANKLLTRRSLSVLRPWLDWTVPIGRA